MLRRTIRFFAAPANLKDRPFLYEKGSTQLVPKSMSVDRGLVGKWSPEDDHDTNKSWRLLRPQENFFVFPTHTTPRMEWEQRAYDFHTTERTLIWAAFDMPETFGICLRDEALAGRPDAYSKKWLDKAFHWINEARYWRCLGIYKPFYDQYTLRAYAWQAKGTNVGQIQFSAAMKDAVCDMERAMRRKAMGLEPNYVWDQWGPCGFVDGRRMDFLPRMPHNPHVDPDGVEVTHDDIRDFMSHEILKQRYEELIFPDPAPYRKAFLSVSNGTIAPHDFNDQLFGLFKKLKQGTQAEGAGESETKAGNDIVRSSNQGNVGTGDDESPPASEDDIRALLYLSVNQNLFSQVENEAKNWEDVLKILEPIRKENDPKIDAARLLHHTSRSKEEVRRFYEEKCGLANFLHSPDKMLTAMSLAHVGDLRVVAGCASDTDAEPEVATQYAEWGAALCNAFSDPEKLEAMGSVAFEVWQELEEIDLENRHAQWADRFRAEGKEEKTLDYVLQNLAKRPQTGDDPQTKGSEFDREMEPIGRKVQRRVLDSDFFDFSKQVDGTQPGTAAKRQSAKASKAFDQLHEQQLQNAGFRA